MAIPDWLVARMQDAQYGQATVGDLADSAASGVSEVPGYVLDAVTGRYSTPRVPDPSPKMGTMGTGNSPVPPPAYSPAPPRAELPFKRYLNLGNEDEVRVPDPAPSMGAMGTGNSPVPPRQDLGQAFAEPPNETASQDVSGYASVSEEQSTLPPATFAGASEPMQINSSEDAILAASSDPESSIAMALDRLRRRRSGGFPGGVVRAGYEMSQVRPAGIPGADKPTAAVPGIADNELAISKEVLKSLSKQERRDYMTRRLEQKPTRVDVSGLTPESPYDRAKSALDERGRMSAFNAQDLEDERARNANAEAVQHAINTYAFEKRAEDIALGQADRKRFIESHMPKLEAEVDRMLSERAKQPEAGSYQDRSFGGRLATAVALGLSTLGSGLTGQENVVLKMIQDEIHADMVKQRQITENFGARFGALRTLYGDMLGKFQSPEAAENATRYALQMASASELRRMAAQEKGLDARNAVNQIADQVEMRALAEKKAALEGEARTLWKYVPPQAPSPTAEIDRLAKKFAEWGVPKEKILPLVVKYLDKGPQAAIAQIEKGPPSSRAELESARFDIGRRVYVPPEFGGGQAWAIAPEQAKKAQEGLESAAQLLKNSARLRKIVMSCTRFSPDDRAVVEQIAATNAGDWRVSLGLGVMSESDKDLISPLTGASINDMSVRDREKILDTNDSLVRQSIEKFTSSLLADPMGESTFTPQIRTKPVK